MDPKEASSIPFTQSHNSIPFWLLFEPWHFWKPLTSLEREDTERSDTENGEFWESPRQWETHWHRCFFLLQESLHVWQGWCDLWLLGDIHQAFPEVTLAYTSSSPLEKQGWIQSPILPSVNTTKSAAFLHVFPLTFSMKDFCLAFSLCHPFLANPFPSFFYLFFFFFIFSFLILFMRQKPHLAILLWVLLSSKICKALPLAVGAFPTSTMPLLNITASLCSSIVLTGIKNMWKDADFNTRACMNI